VAPPGGVALPVTVALVLAVLAGVVGVAVGSVLDDAPGATVPAPEIPGGRAELAMPNADAGPQLAAWGTGGSAGGGAGGAGAFCLGLRCASVTW
jgi:hypothetical protein